MLLPTFATATTNSYYPTAMHLVLLLVGSYSSAFFNEILSCDFFDKRNRSVDRDGYITLVIRMVADNSS